MTRDGAVFVNLVTGETTYPADRTPEQDHSASGDTASAAGKVVDRAELHREQAVAKKTHRIQRRTYWEGETVAEAFPISSSTSPSRAQRSAPTRTTMSSRTRNTVKNSQKNTAMRANMHN